MGRMAKGREEEGPGAGVGGPVLRDVCRCLGLRYLFSWLFILLMTSFWIVITTTTTAKSLQSCPTLCDPTGGSPPGSAVPGILQTRTLEWVAISFSSAWKWKVKVKLLSRVRLFATPWTAAYQTPPSMGFPRHEYWSGVPLPSPNVSPRCPLIFEVFFLTWPDVSFVILEFYVLEFAIVSGCVNSE